MTSPLIQCANVSKTFRIPTVPYRSLRGRVLHPLARAEYNEFKALSDVSFSVERGEFFGIVGRNGSGKSTLLKVLAGIYRPDVGSVNVRGTLAPFIELGVGFNEELSARDNVFINGSLLGLSRRDLQRSYDSIVEFAELEDFMDLKLRNFSSGMQTRLAFSIAIESGAEILLIDEVLAVGDERFQTKCFAVFHERKRRGDTVVFVSHDMGAVQQFCDRAMLLECGSEVLTDDPNSVARAYHTVNMQGHTSDGSRLSDAAAGGEVVEITASRINGDIREPTVADGSELVSVRHGDDLEITVELLTRIPLRDPVVQIKIANRLGMRVLATDSRALSLTAPAMEGETGTILVLSAPNLLAAGIHWMSVEVHASDGTMLAEARDVIQFDVVANSESGGAVDLPWRATWRLRDGSDDDRH